MMIGSKLKFTMAVLGVALLAAACGSAAVVEETEPMASAPSTQPPASADEMPSAMQDGPPLPVSGVVTVDTATAAFGPPRSGPPNPPPSPIEDAEPEEPPAPEPPPAVLAEMRTAVVLDESTRLFVETFGEGTAQDHETSSVLFIVYRGATPYNGFGVATIDAETHEIYGEDLLERGVAVSLREAGFAPPIHRVEVYRATLGARYLREFGGEALPNSYIVRAFGEFDPEAAARALEGQFSILHACHAYCDASGGTGEDENLVFCVPQTDKCHPAQGLELQVRNHRTFTCPPSEYGLGGCFTVYDSVPSGYGYSEETVVPPPILLNDPPPPVHEGGAPYPPGTFPPQHAHLWEQLTAILRDSGRFWGADLGDRYIYRPTAGETDGCPDTLLAGYVRNQLIFWSSGAIDDPEAVIAAELRAEGLEFARIEVRTADHYAEYDPETFINWLSPDNSRYSHFSAIRRLGAELNPALQEQADPYPQIGYWRYPEGAVAYQVILHGHSGDVRTYSLPHASAIDFLPQDICRGAGSPEMHLLAGGLYTTFGDDVVIYDANERYRYFPPRAEPLTTYNPSERPSEPDPAPEAMEVVTETKTVQTTDMEGKQDAAVDKPSGDEKEPGAASEDDEAAGDEDKKPDDTGMKPSTGTADSPTAGTRMPSGEAESPTADPRD